MNLDFSLPADALAEARRRIEEIISSKSTEAHFLDLNLTELPDSLKSAHSVKSLVIGGKAFAGLPDWLANCHHIEGISAIGVTHLPEVVRELKHLKGLQALEGSLDVIPDWIGTLTELELLDFGGNRITKLPSTILQLKRLKELCMRHNRLRTLPKGLDCLPCLERLDLRANRALHLPKEIQEREDPKEILAYLFKVSKVS